MNTALIIKETKSPHSAYEFILSDMLLSDDIDKLGSTIEETLKQESKEIIQINLDISDTHDFLFKPSRLIGLCSYYGECLHKLNKISSLNLIINQRQAVIFRGLGVGLDFHVTVKEGVPSSFQKRAKEKQHVMQTFKITEIIILFCFLALLSSLLFFPGTSLGLALFLSSALLMFEGYIVLRMFNKKIKFLKAITMENRKDLLLVDTLVFSS